MFERYRRVRHGGPAAAGGNDLLDALLPLYRQMLLSRFPSLSSEGSAAEVVA